MSTSLTPASPTAYLDRPEGRVGYDVAGDGPLVVLVPGMGDLRAAYRFLAPVLRDAGYRVASIDLRGHGDSDSAFASYGDVETAGDVLALVEQLGGPAILVGNSMGAGASAIAAAQQPDVVRGLVLLGPFVRNAKPARSSASCFAPRWHRRGRRSRGRPTCPSSTPASGLRTSTTTVPRSSRACIAPAMPKRSR